MDNPKRQEYLIEGWELTRPLRQKKRGMREIETKQERDGKGAGVDNIHPITHHLISVCSWLSERAVGTVENLLEYLRDSKMCFEIMKLNTWLW